MATCRHVGCELQGLGEIRRRGAMKTAVCHNTETELDSLRDFQPMKVTEKWSLVPTSLPRIPGD